jgi:hypothetical protein
MTLQSNPAAPLVVAFMIKYTLIGVNAVRKFLFVLLLFGLCWSSGQSIYLYAQEQYEDTENTVEDPDHDDNEGFLETDWDDYVVDLYSRGDQTVTMSLGVIFPITFLNNGKEIKNNYSPPVGGTGSLGYTYFFGAHFFVGAEVGFVSINTVGQNAAFLVPLGARTGWQFIFRHFEFPLNITIGTAIHRYLNFSYIGMFVKGGVSAFYRFSPEWSFGLNTDFYWYPQWPQENGKPAPEKNVDGFFSGITLSARYHL